MALSVADRVHLGSGRSSMLLKAFIMRAVLSFVHFILWYISISPAAVSVEMFGMYESRASATWIHRPVSSSARVAHEALNGGKTVGDRGEPMGGHTASSQEACADVGGVCIAGDAPLPFNANNNWSTRAVLSEFLHRPFWAHEMVRRQGVVENNYNTTLTPSLRPIETTLSATGGHAAPDQKACAEAGGGWLAGEARGNVCVEEAMGSYPLLFTANNSWSTRAVLSEYLHRPLRAHEMVRRQGVKCLCTPARA